MHQKQTTLSISTRGQGLYEMTRGAVEFTRSTGIETGLLHVFCRHT